MLILYLVMKLEVYRIGSSEEEIYEVGEDKDRLEATKLNCVSLCFLITLNFYDEGEIQKLLPFTKGLSSHLSLESKNLENIGE